MPIPSVLPADNLDFSSAFSFDKTLPITPQTNDQWTPEDYYERGFTIINSLSSPDEAKTALERFIASLDGNRLPLYRQFAGRIQLASEACIPTCRCIVDTTFQGLHFDMGLPITSPSPQVIQLVLALYRPLNGPMCVAATRIVQLDRLLSQRSWPDRPLLESRILSYAREHGDGWAKPKPVNTFRIACLARLIDAADGSQEMTHIQDIATGLEFSDKNNDEIKSFQNESHFFEKHGMELAAVENLICLQPGQLLIIDNVRVAHGRIGRRKPQELWHYLYGIPSASPKDIDALRSELIDQFTPSSLRRMRTRRDQRGRSTASSGG